MTGADSLEGRSLYLCTPDRADLLDFVRSCICGGVDVVQLCDKHLDAKDVIDRSRALRDLCGELDVPFIVNDRPDIALLTGADGVHVGQDDVPVDLVRKLVGPELIVGLSTHEPAQFDSSAGLEVDYLSAGPITPTPTKPGRPGTGLGYVTYATSQTSLPVFVTGGVDPTSIGPIVAAGARHVVVVRYLTQSPDPRGSAEELRAALEAALAGH